MLKDKSLFEELDNQTSEEINGGQSSSCLAVITEPALYTVENSTRNLINYSINNQNYRLSSGDSRQHRIGGGTNSCNAVSTIGIIEFDSSYAEGIQSLSYSLRVNNSTYSFRTVGNGIDLFRIV